MFGANYFGNPYFGQGYAKAGNVFTQTLSAAVAATARLVKQVSLTRQAAVTSAAALVVSYQKALTRLARAVTRALNFPRTTKRMF